MKNRSINRLLTLSLFGVVGCMSPEPVSKAVHVEQRTQALSAVDVVACQGRYAGLKPTTAACPPDTADWALVDELLDPPESGTLSIRMNNYCVYEWLHAGPPPAEPDKLPTDPDGSTEWLDPDCHAVGSAGHITYEMGYHLNETLDRGVDRPQTLPPNPSVSVVAVVDTSPTGWDNGRPGGGQYDHGRSVASAARRLACRNGDCAVDILPVLGLPRTAPQTTNTTDGGYFGFQSELAHGIYKAVRQWKTNQSTSRLVINLSVGWEGRFGGNLGVGVPHLKAAVRMVHDAIKYARCHGALVVAAAGNKGNVTAHDSGALYPAAWAAAPAPNPTKCTGITPHTPGDVASPTTDGLVIPVSGLTRYDDPLRNARVDTRTPLEAPGTSVTVWDVQSNSMRPALTGSSMSTAAVSGALATIWAYNPTLSPSAVAELLYNESIDLNVTADVCHGTPCPNTHRISICAALNEACSLSGSACPGFSQSCLNLAAGTDHAPAVTTNDRNAMAVAVKVDHQQGDHGMHTKTYADCSGLDLIYNDVFTSAPVDPCFANVAGSRVHPWVFPQPDDTGCDICAFIGPDLTMYFAEDTQPYVVNNAAVHVTDGYVINSFDVSDFNTSLSAMDSGKTYQVQISTGLPFIKEAWIDFTVDGVYGYDDVLVY